MKKNYIKFMLQIFFLIIAVSFVVFLVTAFLVNKPLSPIQDMIPILQAILSISLIVGIVSFIFAFPSFLVKIDNLGIKKNFWSKVFLWSDIDHVKIVGISAIKYFNRAVFSGRGRTVEISLFIFDDQEAFLKEIEKHLPWSKGLDITNGLPSEVVKPDRLDY